MRVVVIGGSGHIGTYLIPRLVDAGHDVVAVSRGERQPYTPHAAWRQVEQVTADRTAEEADGSFGRRVAELDGDVVIDLICFTEASARHLAQALDGRVRQFLHCGTIWVHGPSTRVPTTEDRPRRPIAEYGRQKAAYLPWEQWRGTVTEDDARVTYDHIAHSPHCSMEKAARLLGHRPRHTALEAISEAVDRLVATGTIAAAT
ncbi:NAD-dependent epimerase/dehydratase family protein [Nonomuraea sp. B5E05]|uniref:NAD-dependent epimerase/dehydratase family protein n=1 Tax=Nonomuraea sp. B5E05 TaxID=3153569 RepID=UPI0032613DA6